MRIGLGEGEREQSLIYLGRARKTRSYAIVSLAAPWRLSLADHVSREVFLGYISKTTHNDKTRAVGIPALVRRFISLNLPPNQTTSHTRVDALYHALQNDTTCNDCAFFATPCDLPPAGRDSHRVCALWIPRETREGDGEGRWVSQWIGAAMEGLVRPAAHACVGVRERSAVDGTSLTLSCLACIVQTASSMVKLSLLLWFL